MLTLTAASFCCTGCYTSSMYPPKSRRGASSSKGIRYSEGATSDSPYQAEMKPVAIKNNEAQVFGLQSSATGNYCSIRQHKTVSSTCKCYKPYTRWTTQNIAAFFNHTVRSKQSTEACVAGSSTLLKTVDSHPDVEERRLLHGGFVPGHVRVHVPLALLQPLVHRVGRSARLHGNLHLF